MPRDIVGCVFCGGKPTTREHVFSQWVNQVLQEHPNYQPNKVYIRGRASGGETHVKGNILDATVRAVCSNCNNGWMGEIENAALPHVRLMIKGERVRLDRKAQRAVATWAALKATMARYSHSPRLPTIEAQWMELFWREHSIPQSWQVWLGAFRGKSYGAAYEGWNVHDIHSMTPPLWPINRQKLEGTLTRRDYKGVLASFVIGYLTIKVFGVRRLRIVNARPELFVKVAPSKKRLNWPLFPVNRQSSVPHQARRAPYPCSVYPQSNR